MSYGDEKVLVFPRAVLDRVGVFQGLKLEVDTYLREIFAPGVCRFIARGDAEDDPSWKQLIPYVVIRYGESIFTYARGGASREARLRSLFSIGIGGHIQPVDGAADAGPDAYERGVRREVDEEVELPDVLDDRRVALINDDSNPVGQVHFGVVHLLDTARPDVRPREEAIREAGFVTIEALKSQFDGYETWSQLTIEALASGRIR